MKIFKTFLSAVIVGILSLSLVACGGGNGNAIDNEPENPVTGESKILVAYFSYSGNTQTVANMVAENTDGELFRIVPETAYTSDDVFDRAQSELNSGTRPSLSSHIDKDVFASYDVIFIGFPVWWYDLPMPVWTFVEEYDFSGKTVIPFFTHNGSSSGASSLSTLERLLPDANVKRSDALSVRGSSVSGAANTVKNWIDKLEIK